jgi:hypothetical protein
LPVYLLSEITGGGLEPSESDFVGMSREELESRLREFEQKEARLRRHLEELEDITQNAPGSHRSGVPSAETMKAEREIQTVVLALTELDRKRQELMIAMSVAG